MELVTPGIGLLFWMTVSFLTVFFLLKKFAWTPILKMIQEREQTIESALKAADIAREQMHMLQANNEKILNEAKTERDKLMKEAREMKEQIINEAKNKATQQADIIIAGARETINSEKIAAVAEIKNQVATLSIEIAEKILKSELSSSEKQKTLVTSLLNEVKLN
jgi:F-type H+-transporting ATPase subunit b